MASRKVRRNLAKCLPESPQFKGLASEQVILTLFFPDWFLSYAFCFSVSSDEISVAWVWRCQILPAAACEERQVRCQLPDCLGPCLEKRRGQWSGWKLSISKGQLSSLTLKRSLLGFASAL